MRTQLRPAAAGYRWHTFRAGKPCGASARAAPFIAVLAVALVSGQPLAAQAQNADPDEKTLRDAGVGSDRAALLDYFRKRSPASVDPERLDELVWHLGSPGFQEREQASRTLAGLGPAAIPALRKHEKDAEPEIARRVKDLIRQADAGWNSAVAWSAVQVLARRYRADAAEALLGFLPYAAYDPEVEEEVWFTLDAVTAKVPETPRVTGTVPLKSRGLSPFPARKADA